MAAEWRRVKARHGGEPCNVQHVSDAAKKHSAAMMEPRPSNCLYLLSLPIQIGLRVALYQLGAYGVLQRVHRLKIRTCGGGARREHHLYAQVACVS